VNVTYFFGHRKGLGEVWGFGAFQSVRVCNLQATQNDVRNKEKTSFWFGSVAVAW